MVESNTAYWKTKSGKDYQRVQGLRRSHGCTLYDSQLNWLRDCLEQRLSSGAEDHLRLLDFGCGFGRVAHFCDGMPQIEYYGYDFSKNMVDGLRENPPGSLIHNLEDRVRVAPSVSECFSNRAFDIILTVAVLIHNEEDKARSILNEFLGLLEENGEIILIENPITNKTARCNLWHGGCWSHDFAGYLSDLMSVTVDVTTLPDQAIYRIRKPRSKPELTIVRGGVATSYPSLEVFHRVVPPPNVTEIIETDCDQASLIAELHDAQELLSYERKRADEAESLTKRLESDLKVLKNQFRLGDHISRLANAPQNRKSIRASKIKRDDNFVETRELPWLFNAPRDLKYSRPDHPVFEGVLTTFTQDWTGIRAASGSFPGHKLAIAKDHNWSKGDLVDAFETIRGFGAKAIVAHGLSPGLASFLVAVRKAMPEIRIYGVWHGALASWCMDDERALAAQFLKMADEDVYNKIHFMKRGHDILHRKTFAPLLPNLVPMYKFNRLAPAWRKKPITCLFGAWNNVWKNMYSNIVGAAASDSVEKVFTYAPVMMTLPKERKISVCKYTCREDHFALAATCDLMLNVTTLDCHPMLEMEALAVCTPCLRADLDLDFGRGHDYQRLFTLTSAHNPNDIKARIEDLAKVDTKELEDVVLNYRDLVTDTSFERYSEFLNE